MESIVKADIFFFVTTLSIVLVTVGIAVVIFYVVKILRDVKHISDKVRVESDEIMEDVKSFRHEVKKESSKIRDLVGFFLSFLKPKGKVRKNKKASKK